MQVSVIFSVMVPFVVRPDQILEMRLGLYFTSDSRVSTGIGKGSDVGNGIGVGTRVLGPLAGAVAVPEAPYPPAPAGIMQVQVQITMQRNNFDVTTQRNPHGNKCKSNIRDRNKLKRRLSHNHFHNQYHPRGLQFVRFRTNIHRKLQHVYSSLQPLTFMMKISCKDQNMYAE
jgi:hypothetical protein